MTCDAKFGVRLNSTTSRWLQGYYEREKLAQKPGSPGDSFAIRVERMGWSFIRGGVLRLRLDTFLWAVVAVSGWATAQSVPAAANGGGERQTQPAPANGQAGAYSLQVKSQLVILDAVVTDKKGAVPKTWWPRRLFWRSGATAVQAARKPDSVLDDHSSRPWLTPWLEQPTRGFRLAWPSHPTHARCA